MIVSWQITGKSIQERIKNTAKLSFVDEEGNPRSFTWRTISTWYYRYKNHGVTGVTAKDRSDKGKTRKISPEELMEVINQVRPYFVNKRHTRFDIYRMCIEKGILTKEQLAPTTYYRFIREYDLLNDNIEHNKKRLAFAMEHANDLWQADTMFGPHVKNCDGRMIQTKLIAFIDDASRVIKRKLITVFARSYIMVNDYQKSSALKTPGHPPRKTKGD